MSLDRILYRLLTGSWRRFTFRPEPVSFDVTSIPDPVGLYVHIPFCRSLCPFCPYTKTLYEPDLARRYASALESEAKSVLSNLGGKRISSIYFGGGTPLMLSEAVESVAHLVRPSLAAGAQVAVEVHPHDITPQAVRRLADAGVNMMSLGAESLDDAILKSLGRNHDSASALAALDLLLDSGCFSVNVDLMTGVPGQRLDSAASHMRRVVERRVDQVSAYPLMDFPFTNMRTQLSIWGQRRLLQHLCAVGDEAGYSRSSVWTWTKPNAPKYASITREDYVGIGAGAASRLCDRFWLNTFSVEGYVDALASRRSAVALGATLSPVESALYRLFWRCYEGGFDLGSSEAKLIHSLPRLVAMAEWLGLARTQSFAVSITDKGLFLYHLLERYYTRRYIGRLWQVCRESAFPVGMEL